jgi:hypothetical protein
LNGAEQQFLTRLRNCKAVERSKTITFSQAPQLQAVERSRTTTFKLGSATAEQNNEFSKTGGLGDTEAADQAAAARLHNLGSLVAGALSNWSIS